MIWYIRDDCKCYGMVRVWLIMILWVIFIIIIIIIIIITIIIIIIIIIHNGNRSSVCLMHFPPSYKRLWARWRGLALKVNHNVSKNAIYKLINILRGGMKEKRRKLLLCMLRFISYRFMVCRYKTDA